MVLGLLPVDRRIVSLIGIKSELHLFLLDYDQKQRVLDLPASPLILYQSRRLLTLDVNQGRTALSIFARVFAKVVSHGVSRSVLLGV
jgi:hypothetical protein